MYLFNWDDVPGNDSRRLIKFLKDNIKMGGVESAKIKKSDYGKAINVANKENSLVFKLNKKEDKVKLEISDEETYEYILRNEGNELNIYSE